MNPKYKQDWIDALRSGKYKQGKGRLCSDEGFCCLGVLCDVKDPSKWTNLSAMRKPIGTSKYMWSKDAWMVYGLGKDQMEELDITPEQHDKLIELNDDFGYNFERIADYIEENL